MSTPQMPAGLPADLTADQWLRAEAMRAAVTLYPDRVEPYVRAEARRIYQWLKEGY